MCNQGADSTANTAPDGCRLLHGYGPFLLVRVTQLSLAWVHEQCARWSPEVWEDGSGDLVVRITCWVGVGYEVRVLQGTGA